MFYTLEVTTDGLAVGDKVNVEFDGGEDVAKNIGVI